MVKSIAKAFDHMEMCFVLQAEELFLFFKETTFVTEFLDSNLLLPILSIGSQWDFQVANLLLLFSNHAVPSHNISFVPSCN